MVRKSFSPLAGHSFVPCQFPVLSFIKHHGILHLFKNQYPQKTILVYREETEIYTTFKLSFAHCKTKTNPNHQNHQNQNQPQITNYGGLNWRTSLLSFGVCVHNLVIIFFPSQPFLTFPTTTKRWKMKAVSKMRMFLFSFV